MVSPIIVDVSHRLEKYLSNNDNVVYWAIILASMVLGYVVRRFKEGFPVLKLKRVFGEVVRDGSGINISLPIWTAIPKNRSAFRFLRSGSNGESEKYYGPDVMINKNDMIAAKYVNDIFVNTFRHSPAVYVYDTDKPYLGDATIIIIGSPIANFHARHFLPSHYESPVESTTEPALPYKFVEMKESDVTGAKIKIVRTKDNHSFESNENDDYGIVMRIKNIFGKYKHHYIFIVAGIHETSTAEAGFMLKSRWREFVGHASFKGFVFQMVRGQKGTGRIVDRKGM